MTTPQVSPAGKPPVPLSLSELRALWRQAYSLWRLDSDKLRGTIFRGYVREEMVRRTIVAQEQCIAELQAKLAEAKEQIYQLERMVSLEFEQAMAAGRRTSSSAGDAAESEAVDATDLPK